MLETLGITNAGAFLLGTTALMLTPGPNSLLVLSTGARFGKKAGWKSLAGVAIGDAVLMFLASAGATAALTAWPLSFAFIRIAGACYLFWLGLRILLRELRGPGPQNCPSRSARENFSARALLVSLSNPNTIIFYISFFIQFVDPLYPHKALSFFILACIVELVSITYLSLLIIAGSSIAIFFQNRYRVTRFFRCLLGVLFLCFGLRLALAGLL